MSNQQEAKVQDMYSHSTHSWSLTSLSPLEGACWHGKKTPLNNSNYFSPPYHSILALIYLDGDGVFWMDVFLLAHGMTNGKKVSTIKMLLAPLVTLFGTTSTLKKLRFFVWQAVQEKLPIASIRKLFSKNYHLPLN